MYFMAALSLPLQPLKVKGNVKWTKCFKDYNVTAISIPMWYEQCREKWYVGKRIKYTLYSSLPILLPCQK